MAISKRILNKRNRQRSRKGGVITKLYNSVDTANSSELKVSEPYKSTEFVDQLRNIIVVMSKLAGNVPAKADELSKMYGNAPVYFGWCPFNTSDSNPNDLLDSTNINRLKYTWSNVDHEGDIKHSKILKRWCGVSTDPLNSTECIKFLETLKAKDWPSFTVPELSNLSKQGMSITEFYMKRVATVLYHDRLQVTDFFKTFLYNYTKPTDDSSPSLETAFEELKQNLDSAIDKETVLRAWTKKYTKKFVISFNNLQPDEMTAYVFSDVFKKIYNHLLKQGSLDQTQIDKFNKKLTAQDLNTSYSALFGALAIKDIVTGGAIEAFRLDNFFKSWIDGIPKELSLVTTDGCVAMAVLAIDIYEKNPVEDTTQKEYMVEMGAFDNYELREWSAKLLREKFFSTIIMPTQHERKSKHVHVIVDMESDDLFALRILANFYEFMTVYIASNSSDTTTDDELFIRAKAYLKKNKPTNIKIHDNPIFCHKASPNGTKICEHYIELNKVNPIEEMTAIIQLLSSKSGGKAKRRNSIKRRKSSKRRNLTKRRKSKN